LCENIGFPFVKTYEIGDRLHTFTSQDLANIAIEAEDLITQLGDRHFEPTPSVANCSICPYSVICESSVS
jgi:hypothetical protein